MNTNREEGRDQTSFTVQTSFSDRCIGMCKKLMAQMENVKAGIVSEFRDRLDDHQRVLELAVNEAEALAWETGFPQLVFPTLAVEKARAAAGWHARQQRLLGYRAPRELIAA